MYIGLCSIFMSRKATLILNITPVTIHNTQCIILGKNLYLISYGVIISFNKSYLIINVLLLYNNNKHKITGKSIIISDFYFMQYIT